jgi:hypothetical protein
LEHLHARQVERQFAVKVHPFGQVKTDEAPRPKDARAVLSRIAYG